MTFGLFVILFVALHMIILTESESISHIVVAVTVHGANEDDLSNRIKSIQTTWGRHFDHVYFYTNNTHPGLNDSHIVNVNHDSNYPRASSEEMFGLFDLYNLFPNASWYYKCDDDAWVHAYELNKYAEIFPNPLHKQYYIGSRCNYVADESTNSKKNQLFCAGGCGYLISNALMQKMHPYLLNPMYIASDVTVGLLAEKFNTTCHHNGRFLFGNYYDYIPKHLESNKLLVNFGYGKLLNPIAVHRASPSIQKILELHIAHRMQQDMYHTIVNKVLE